MDDLIRGYKTFRDAFFPHHHDFFKQLADGQSPKAMVIACCDSRIDPTLIFQARLGEIFTLRNIANLVPPYAPDGAPHSTSAALEYAVTSLKVRHLIVMGHSGCGGVRALLQDQRGEFIGPWMNIAAAARDHAAHAKEGLSRQEILTLCEQENIRISLANLLGYPWVAERVAQGSLRLHGCYFEIEHARLFVLKDASGGFEPV